MDFGGSVVRDANGRIICPVDGCVTTVGRPEDLQRHRNTQHEEGPLILCRLCDWSTRRKDKVTPHVNRHHGSQEVRGKSQELFCCCLYRLIIELGQVSGQSLLASLDASSQPPKESQDSLGETAPLFLAEQESDGLSYVTVSICNLGMLP